MVVSLLGPEIEAEESSRDSVNTVNDDTASAQEEGSGDGTQSDSGENNEGRDGGRNSVTPARNLRGVWQLGSGLPTAGSLLATLWSGPGSKPPIRDIPPGGGYTIEVLVDLAKAFAWQQFAVCLIFAAVVSAENDVPALCPAVRSSVWAQPSKDRLE